MSRKSTISIDCPACQRTQEVLVWNSLNAQLSPEAKADLFEGKINHFECEACGQEVELGIDFMYNDMELQYTVQFHAPQLLDDEKFLNFYGRNGQLNPALVGGIVKGAEYMGRPHVVFNMEEVALYVAFRDKLAQFHPNSEKDGSDHQNDKPKKGWFRR